MESFFIKNIAIPAARPPLQPLCRHKRPALPLNRCAGNDSGYQRGNSRFENQGQNRSHYLHLNPSPSCFHLEHHMPGPGLKISFEYTNHVYSHKSQYQKIDIYETKSHGKLLMLDDIVMITEKDEFFYHEMLSHVPIQIHQDAKSVPYFFPVYKMIKKIKYLTFLHHSVF